MGRFNVLFYISYEINKQTNLLKTLVTQMSRTNRLTMTVYANKKGERLNYVLLIITNF